MQAENVGVVQSCCRSLIVDTLSIPQQQLGSAWATRMSAVGHLIGYGIGSIDMVATFGNFLGDTQFKKMCVVAASALVFATSFTSWAVKERILVSNGYNFQFDTCTPRSNLLTNTIVKQESLRHLQYCALCYTLLFICLQEYKPFVGYSFGRGLVGFHSYFTHRHGLERRIFATTTLRQSLIEPILPPKRAADPVTHLATSADLVPMHLLSSQS